MAWARSIAPGTSSSIATSLTNATNDKDLEYLSDGIADSLIQSMSKLRALRVRPIGAVLDFKSSKLDPQSVDGGSASKRFSPARSSGTTTSGSCCL